jgi:hypothetical protein
VGERLLRVHVLYNFSNHVNYYLIKIMLNVIAKKKKNRTGYNETQIFTKPNFKSS